MVHLRLLPPARPPHINNLKHRQHHTRFPLIRSISLALAQSRYPAIVSPMQLNLPPRCTASLQPSASHPPSFHPTTHENESEPTGRLRARTVSRHYSSARISVTQHPFVGVVDGHHRARWAIVSLHATTPLPPPPASSLSCAACALLYQPPVHHKNRWRHHASPSSYPPHPEGDCPLHEKRRAGCREGVAAVQRVFIATSYRGERAPPCAARTFERYASQQ